MPALAKYECESQWRGHSRCNPVPHLLKAVDHISHIKQWPYFVGLAWSSLEVRPRYITEKYGEIRNRGRVAQSTYTDIVRTWLRLSAGDKDEGAGDGDRADGADFL